MKILQKHKVILYVVLASVFAGVFIIQSIRFMARQTPAYKLAVKTLSENKRFKETGYNANDIDVEGWFIKEKDEYHRAGYFYFKLKDQEKKEYIDFEIFLSSDRGVWKVDSLKVK